MLKKKCPECGAYTYSTNREMEKCGECGVDISKIEAVPAGKKSHRSRFKQGL